MAIIYVESCNGGRLGHGAACFRQYMDSKAKPFGQYLVTKVVLMVLTEGIIVNHRDAFGIEHPILTWSGIIDGQIFIVGRGSVHA